MLRQDNLMNKYTFSCVYHYGPSIGYDNAITLAAIQAQNDENAQKAKWQKDNKREQKNPPKIPTQTSAAPLNSVTTTINSHRLTPKTSASDDEYNAEGSNSLDCKELATLLTEFHLHIQELEKTKGKNTEVAKTAQALHDELIHLKNSYFQKKKTNETYQAFRKNALNAINKAKPILNEHHDLKQIVGNIILAIFGLGVIYGAACLINKAVTGSFLFFKPTILKQTEKIESFVMTLSRP